ncbi:MAG: YdcF family protein [Candidatus Microsaccharimonas sossegonensis]|uniref:YdcF family protein n=1 Tax=Candidatus Microsaccharimonas sossegonensis TaxID=2506948 RepID=A0A4Q0AGA4_9BACT|nr:MAG: YdcF family protein [Candidatus Microsaccharimonas sossegonensis]
MIKWFFIVPAVVAAIIGAISFYLQPNDFIGCGDKPATGTAQCVKADAIVVVSGGDTIARTDEGIKLLQNGWANSIVFSGAAQDKSGPSNAATMRQRALSAGVPAASIYVEERSATTAENALNTSAILANNNFNNVILVTSGYHQRRSELAFKKENTKITVLNHPLLQDKDWSFWWWLSPRGWWLAGGELVKIAIFYLGGASP